MSKEYWVKNRTSAELVVSELNLKIPAGKPVNLFRLQPNLTHDQVARSEQEGGALYKLFPSKLVKLIEAPVKTEIKKPFITEAKTYMPTRSRSSVVVDVKKHSFIDELSSFDEAVAAGYDDEGFADPIAQAMGHDGEKFGSENEAFSANVVTQVQTEAALSPGNPAKVKQTKSATGEIIIHTEE